PAPAPAPVPAGAREATLDPAALDSIAELGEGEEGDIIAELVYIFSSEARPRMERLRAALAARDAEEVRREAHGLKGSAASIGAKALAEIARTLEEGGRAGSVEGGEDLMRDLEEEFDRVRAALDAYVAARPAGGEVTKAG
ncbi:MAG: Hpt domain-containing protein, partial [Planctomycetes bacterium]|nr:Hpt domain-containing protein [Planctomycetota bacterium]